MWRGIIASPEECLCGQIIDLIEFPRGHAGSGVTIASIAGEFLVEV